MVTVPDILQRLVAHHGVDAVALVNELGGHDRVRTRTWMAGSGTPRHVLQCLPSAFPPFKALVVDRELRIERLRLGGGAVFQNGATFSRIVMPWPELPETIVAALPGRPLSELLGHPGIGRTTTIVSVARRDEDDEPHMVLRLDMPRDALQPVDTTPSAAVVTQIPEIDEIIGETHQRIDAPALSDESAVDTRTWREELGVPALKILGLRIERPVRDDEAHIAIRFPYDKDTVALVGRAGMGAWFDRNTYAWQLEPTARAVEWLREFVATRDVVIGPDGHISCRRTA